MRVALIDPSLFTLPYDVALAGGLSRAGNQVTLHGRALRAHDGDPGAVAVVPSFYAAAGAPWATRLPRAVRLAVKGVDHVASMRGLRRRLAAERPDVIHFQWLPLPVFDRGLLPGFRRVAPVVLTVHDTDPFNGSPTAGLQRMGFTASLAACDRLIVHTRQGLARLVALGLPASRVALLPHGPLADQAQAGEPDVMQGELAFVLLGKIKPYKGADVLIEAFGALPEAMRRRARVRIVGQAYMDLAPLRARAAALGIADRVAIEDRFVADGEMASMFSPGSIAVFPYREIEASGVLSLAMAHGRPVIASRLGNFAETLTDGVHGRLLAPADRAALTGALQHMIEDRGWASACAEAMRALVRVQPGWDEIARRTVGVYEASQADRRVRAAAPQRGTAQEAAP